MLATSATVTATRHTSGSPNAPISGTGSASRSALQPPSGTSTICFGESASVAEPANADANATLTATTTSAGGRNA